MNKILNIALGDMSSGELGIAFSFIENQVHAQRINYILIPEEKKQILDEGLHVKVFALSKENPSAENQKYVTELISQIKPNLIILFDVFTFEYAQNWTGCNLDYLKKFNIPIVSLDEYEYTRTNYKIDYYGIFVKKLPALLNQCDYILKNCPLAMPRCQQNTMETESPTYYYYKVFQKLDLIDLSSREQIRKSYFGVNDFKTRVVFFTTSFWEVEGAYSFACQNQLSKWIGPIVYHYLSDLKEKIVLFHVGKENWKIDSNLYVQYIHVDSMRTKEFEKVLQASDLFITYNIVSITLSKAVMFNVPSLVLNNRKIIDFEKLKSTVLKRPEWYREMAYEVKKVYPFSASLFGWENFLKPCLQNNSYVDTFKRADVFNYNMTLTLLRDMLYDDHCREQLIKKGTEFKIEYERIPSSEAVLETILE